MQHGKPATYRAGGCRCEPCKVANTEDCRQRRKARAARTDAPHGTITGYANWDCRCEPCRAAGSEMNTRANRRTGQPGPRPWTPDEDRQVLRADLTAFEIAIELRRSYRAVASRRQTLRRREARRG